MPTAHEKFATLFDVYQPSPEPDVAHTRGLSGVSAGNTVSFPSGTFGMGGGGTGGSLDYATAQPVYGFGTASMRFNNTEFPGQKHGLVNKVRTVRSAAPCQLYAPSAPAHRPGALASPPQPW
jgi:hypothetical protein